MVPWSLLSEKDHSIVRLSCWSRWLKSPRCPIVAHASEGEGGGETGSAGFERRRGAGRGAVEGLALGPVPVPAPAGRRPCCSRTMR